MTANNFDKALLNKLLKEIHLPTIRNCYESVIKSAEKGSLKYEEFLFELVRRECEERKQRKIERLLKQSRLPLEKTMESFDLKRLPMKA